MYDVHKRFLNPELERLAFPLSFHCIFWELFLLLDNLNSCGYVLRNVLANTISSAVNVEIFLLIYSADQDRKSVV